MATIPLCPEAPARGLSNRVEYQISTITPMFGGGVRAGEPDPDLPVRGTAVRGHLQFWWRATVGAAFSTHRELFEKSTEIWGTTTKASAVAVEIGRVTCDPATACATYHQRSDGTWQLRWNEGLTNLAYALFPFQGQQPKKYQTAVDKPPARLIKRVSFVLRLRYPIALKQDVETAVRAWVSFGGLGARTRRGCGALSCPNLAPRDVADLQRWFRTHRGSSVIRDWPTLPDYLHVGREASTMEAWQLGIEPLRSFRQGPGVARNHGKGARPGRSFYPEPEAIREATHRRSHAHRRLPDIPDDAFPRAELGLPIVFHFNTNGAPGEPEDTVLYPRDVHGARHERMASPLILKPLALANGRSVPIVMRLQAPPLPGVALMTTKGEQVEIPASSVVRGPALQRYRHSPLKGSPSGSALDAFMRSLEGFQEIR